MGFVSVLPIIKRKKRFGANYAREHSRRLTEAGVRGRKPLANLSVSLHYACSGRPTPAPALMQRALHEKHLVPLMAIR